MSEPRDIRERRITMRANHRGTKEMDIILGKWVQQRLADASAEALDTFESLMDENDQDLYQWVTDQAPAPQEFKGIVADLQLVVGMCK